MVIGSLDVPSATSADPENTLSDTLLSKVISTPGSTVSVALISPCPLIWYGVSPLRGVTVASLLSRSP